MFKRELNAKLVLSVIATGIMSFSGVVVETAMNVTFPTLMEEFSIGTSTVQWMTTSYLLIPWSYRLGYEHPCRSSKCSLCTCMRSLYPPCYHGNRALCAA